MILLIQNSKNAKQSLVTESRLRSYSMGGEGTMRGDGLQRL